MSSGEFDDWLEGGSASDLLETANAKGRVVTKSELAKITGLAEPTIARAVKDGAPVISMGSRREGWRINTASFFAWFWRRKVEEATVDPDATGLEVAKLRDKEAQARARELANAQKEGSLVPVDAVIDYNRKKYGVVRSRFLAVESQVIGLTPEQREQLHAAILDAFTDISTQPLEDWYDAGTATEDDSEGA